MRMFHVKHCETNGGDVIHIVPINIKQANKFIEQFHRHHHSVPGCKFCLGVAEGSSLIGVAVVGLPLSRHLMDGETLEVRRTCTDGTKNANSMLYGAAWRVTQGLGYHRLLTYTLPEESGASLRAVGWTCCGLCGGGSWDTQNSNRPRLSRHPQCQKLRWEITTQDYLKFLPVEFEGQRVDSQIMFFE